MMNGRKVIFFVGLLSVSQLLLGADNYFVSNGETKIGEWNSNITQTIAKGETDNIPIVMVGTAFGCTFCANFESSILPNQKFKQWVADSPYYFLYAYSGSGWWTTKELKAFIDIVGNGGLPRIGGYWKKKDGTVIGGQQVSFVGRGYSVDHYISFWDNLFKDYNPNVNDQWDPADDTNGGATDLGSPVAETAVTELHYMNAAGDHPDKADWFKLNLAQGKRYSLYQDLSTYENAAPKVDVIDPSGNVIKTMSTQTEMFIESPCVFTAEATGTYYVKFYYDGSVGRSSYKLAYREFEEVAYGFKQTEITVKENATNVVLTLTRSGRMTDSVSARVSTTDGTARAGVDYTALTGASVTFAANKTEATVSVPVIDIPGNQGNKSFTVTCMNPEDGAGAECLVTIEDLDIPADDKDPGDDTRDGATAFAIVDQTSSVKESEGASRVVSGSGLDAEDWYVFSALEQGKTYQVKVPTGAYTKRPATAASDPTVKFFLGAADEPFHTATLAELMASPYRFEAEGSGDLTVLVVNEVSDGTVFTYDLAWQEWVLPVVGFSSDAAAVASAAQADTSVTVTLKRTKNLEEAITVQVAVSGVEGRVNAVTSEVRFAAGSDTATLTVPILADGGFWKPEETFTLTVLEDAAVHQNAEGAVHLQTMTLKTAMSEFDADDGDANSNVNAANATALTVSKRPTTRSGLTLNGSDKGDWYSFPVEKDVEYAFEIVDVLPETDEMPPLEVKVLLPGEGETTTVPLDECLGATCRFIPATSGTVAIGISRTADDPQSVSYGLKYREWVPATIGFTTNAIEVSEFASSVRIPVQCDMEVSLPASVAVKTRDGTAKAGEDYVTLDTILSWDEHSPSSSVKYTTVNLKKLIAEYEGVFEEFEVYLDFDESEGLPGEITSLSVKVIEVDTGSVGTFSIAGYSLDGGMTLKPYQAKQIPVIEGEELKVKVVRIGGNAGEVGLTLTWADGTTAKATMADLETETWIDVYIPDSDGQYVARQVKSLTLTTGIKSAKTQNATLNFSITDSDAALQTYSVSKTSIAVETFGNAWYVGANGLIRTKTSVKANDKMSMTATLRGPGTLSFKKIQTGSGTIMVLSGSTALGLSEHDGVVSAQIPAGTRRITITFTATSVGASLAVDELTFTPNESFFNIGTFYGDVMLNEQIRGLATLTATSSGRVSGKLTVPPNQIWIVTGKLVDGATDDAVVRRARAVLENSVIAVTNQGELDAQAGMGSGMEFDVIGARNGWSDRPLIGTYAESEGLLGQTIEYSDNDGELIFKVGANGSTRVVGTYYGKRISASVVPFARDGRMWAVLVNSALPNGILFKFSCDEDVWSVTKE
ncbi:MAG: hypothetical protein IJU44_12970 [Kiritimatiellae bacterium]|nr:hypothetical protein [Kiritimatiellia bacterium]